MIKGRIYTIRSFQTDKYYIGSTTQKLCKRLQDHRMRYKHGKYMTSQEIIKYKRNASYITSYEIIKYNDNYIELLENYECKDKNELRRREGELQRDHKDNIVNCRIENRTNKEYYENNKERLNEMRKIYYENNKESINEKSKIYRENNKEKEKKRTKIYHENNKERLNERHRKYNLQNKERLKEKHNCICGGKYTINHKLRHERSKKHIKYITNLKRTDIQTHQA